MTEPIDLPAADPAPAAPAGTPIMEARGLVKDRKSVV